MTNTTILVKGTADISITKEDRIFGQNRQWETYDDGDLDRAVKKLLLEKLSEEIELSYPEFIGGTVQVTNIVIEHKYVVPHYLDSDSDDDDDDKENSGDAEIVPYEEKSWWGKLMDLVIWI